MEKDERIVVFYLSGTANGIGDLNLAGVVENEQKLKELNKIKMSMNCQPYFDGIPLSYILHEAENNLNNLIF